MWKPSGEELREAVKEAVSQALEGGGREICADAQSADRDKTPGGKPEHMTHLRGDQLVCKDHPRIAFRGAIDSLEAELILLQILTKERGLEALTEDLEEIIRVNRWLLRCEVSGEPVGKVVMQGLNTDEMRAHSHHPSQYYGMRHFLPNHFQGEIPARLNLLRTKARELELTAYRAFKLEDGQAEREDILRVLNRLSSLFWIMMFKYLTGRYADQAERKAQDE